MSETLSGITTIKSCIGIDEMVKKILENNYSLCGGKKSHFKNSFSKYIWRIIVFFLVLLIDTCLKDFWREYPSSFLKSLCGMYCTCYGQWELFLFWCFVLFAFYHGFDTKTFNFAIYPFLLKFWKKNICVVLYSNKEIKNLF